MIIRRLDFFKTQLTLDTPNFFNSVTNVAFAPLQHLIGQHKYQSLQGRVSLLSPTSSVDYGNTARRVISVFALMLAVVFTPIGIATRYLSLRSMEVNETFSIIFVLQLTDSEYTEQMPHLSAKQIEARIQAQEEKTKKASLDAYLDLAIASLETLESKLKKGAHSAEIAEHRNDEFYPFPLLLIQQMESNPTIVARANKVRWDRLISLRQSCLELLTPSGGAWDEDSLQQTLQEQAKSNLTSAFGANARFLNTLKTKLESTQELAGIPQWLKEQRSDPNYPFSFYTQSRVLKLLVQLKNDPVKIQKFAQILDFCSKSLKEIDLEEYVTEIPPSNHEIINKLLPNLDRLESIAKFQNLIETQSA